SWASLGIVESPPKRRSTENSIEFLGIIGTCRVSTETSIYRGLNRGLGHHWDSSSPHRNVDLPRTQSRSWASLGLIEPSPKRRSTENSIEVLGIIGTRRVPTKTSIYRGLNRGLGHHWDSSSPHRNNRGLGHHWDSSSPHQNVDLPRTQSRSWASLGLVEFSPKRRSTEDSIEVLGIIGTHQVLTETSI
ncbi:14609_t:CDS:1, partial [Gigaspora rosea]